jgi:hypothetical protein
MNRSVLLITLAVLLGSASCSPGIALHQSTDVELLAAFNAGRTRIEFHGGPIDVVVLSADIETGTGAALRRARSVIQPDQVPKSTTVSLPAKYFLLKSLRVDGAQGRLSGTLGPVSNPVSMAACGSTFEVALDRLAGVWQAKVVSLTVC